MIIKTKDTLDITDYVVIVEAIVKEYFDESGAYTPHIGLLNAMRIFYNEVVTDTDIDVPHNVVNTTEMETFVNDKDFIAAFNVAIRGSGELKLDFANAYKDALDIVATKKNSFGTVIDNIQSVLVNFADKITPAFTGENVDKIAKIAEDIANGKLSSEAIATAYGNSDAFQQILAPA
jgi:hypothetical protein